MRFRPLLIIAIFVALFTSSVFAAPSVAPGAAVPVANRHYRQPPPPPPPVRHGQHRPGPGGGRHAYRVPSRSGSSTGKAIVGGIIAGAIVGSIIANR